MTFMEENLTQSHRGTPRGPSVNEITEAIIGAGIEIHQALGPGLLESVYESILEEELRLRGLSVQRQVELPVHWKGNILGQTFRIDLVVGGQVIVELKSVEITSPVHKKQVLTYLKLTGLHVGLLLNFGCALFKDGVERIILGKLE